MYSLKCNYYSKKFNSINELVDDIVVSGMDPNYSITKDGEDIGEQAIDFISFQITNIIRQANDNIINKYNNYEHNNRNYTG